LIVAFYMFLEELADAVAVAVTALSFSKKICHHIFSLNFFGLRRKVTLLVFVHTASKRYKKYYTLLADF